MAQGGVWGGGIEMAAVSHLKRVNVFVYQARALTFTPHGPCTVTLRPYGPRPAPREP